MTRYIWILALAAQLGRGEEPVAVQQASIGSVGSCSSQTFSARSAANLLSPFAI